MNIYGKYSCVLSPIAMSYVYSLHVSVRVKRRGACSTVKICRTANIFVQLILNGRTEIRKLPVGVDEIFLHYVAMSLRFHLQLGLQLTIPIVTEYEDRSQRDAAIVISLRPGLADAFSPLEVRRCRLDVNENQWRPFVANVRAPAEIGIVDGKVVRMMVDYWTACVDDDDVIVLVGEPEIYRSPSSKQCQ